MGMEAHDLIFILLFASIMNLLFGGTRLAFYMVFVLPAFMVLGLWIGKRGKPDGFLLHWLRYYFQAGHFVAGSESKERDLLKQRIYF